VRPRRRAAAALAVAAGCLLPAGAGWAGQEDRPRDENRAVAVVETDGQRRFDVAFQIVRQRGGTVDALNVANAAARCTGCRATAIAFQVVLVEGSPARVAPRNQAVAINDRCTQCVVYAGARQFVRVVDEPTRFTEAGRATLADVRRDLRALEGRDLTAGQLAAAVEQQEARVLQVLRAELRAADDEDDDDVVDRRTDRQADDD